MAYKILERPGEIENAHKAFLEILQKNATRKGKIVAGFQGGTNTITACWFESENIWCGYQKLTDVPIPRFWNACSVGPEPKWDNVKSSVSITCEINMPLRGAERSIGGAFVIDDSGRLFLAHDGRVGGGKKGISKSAFLENHSQNYEIISATDSRGERRMLLLSSLDDKNFIKNLAKFVHDVSDFKEEKGETQYFLLQVGSFGSPHVLNEGYHQHEDWDRSDRWRVRGEVKSGDLLLVYFTSTAIKYKKTLKMIYKVKSVTKNNVRFNIEPWKELRGISLDQIRDAIEKKRLGDIFNRVTHEGFNIGKLTKSDFDAILKMDGGSSGVIVDEQRFQEAHKIFEKEMYDRSGGIPFTSFNHPQLLKDEINYKKQIVEKTESLRSSSNLDQWIKTKGALLTKIREACSQKTSENLLMGAQYGAERSSASSLDLVPETLMTEYERILYDFFISANSSTDEFGEKFDQLIEFLQKNELSVNWRYLAYLSFIANPAKYFPIQPTLFEKLLQFYGNQYKLRASFSWNQYSILLELAEILKSKLAKYGNLDSIQIQSYMWVVSKLIENISMPATESDDMSRLSEIPSEFSEYENLLQIKNQVIFYGPPGTGKTFTAKKFANYFIRGNSTNPNLTFRSAAIRILKEEGKPLHYQEIAKRALDRNLVLTSGETPQATFVAIMSREAKRKPTQTIFKKIGNGVYDLNYDLLNESVLPEDNAVNDNEFIRMVTFHPSYSYEDFIEGIRPRQNDTQITYDIEPGIFKIICEDAKADPNNRYVLLIDEINRGNISKIFGELITLIENDKRAKDPLHLTYSKESFAVPKNLYIIGTMNTADRSLTQLDVALRRRFGFVELMPDYDLIDSSINGVNLANLLKNLNAKIRQHEGREKQIGHSYLMKNQKPIQTIEELQFVFENEIIPLLQDYFYEDFEKLHEVLGNDFVDIKNMEIKSEWKSNTSTFVAALKPFVTNE